MKEKLSNNKEILLLLLLSLLIIWPLFVPGYFPHHDDLQVIRIHQMRTCFESLQIPCRWVPDMGYGNGFPLFNYYPVLPYYFGALFSYVFGFIGAAKILFLIPLVFGGIFMFLLAREIFKDRYIAMISAVLFMFAPYRALDAYVRGAVAESFAIAVVPLVFYFGVRLSKTGEKSSFVGFTLSLTALLLSHNIMVVLFVPTLILWLALWLYFNRWKYLKEVGISTLLAFGLSSFFIVPAYQERGLVQVSTLTKGALDFRVHFVSVKQMFIDRFWGYGASMLGSADTMSFQIGWPHWWLVLLSVIALFFYLFVKKNRKYVFVISYMLIIFFGSLLMMHNKSTLIWENIRILEYFQFPWRFLSAAIFSASVLGGFVFLPLKKRYIKILTFFIVLLTIILSWSYFRPSEFVKISDNEKLSGESWDIQRKSAILDYLPITATEPREPAPESPLITSGNAVVDYFDSDSKSWTVKLNSPDEATVVLPVYDFPGWTVSVDSEFYKHSIDNIGRIEVLVGPGTHELNGKFRNTTIRSVSNIISLISIIALLFFINEKYYKKYINK